ncbi:hypothetical protein ACIRQF_30310 [Streptomyces sp. NPDC101191]|uniref:hypothetical protein n=1 Tax=Streptomyces sp. NPDC101191 TaxID=3366126 RepID=UPI00380CDDCA
MQAEFVRRRMAQGLVAAMFAASLVVTGPAAPKAQAISFNPCNAPGGKWVCDKAEAGAKWLYDNSGADSVVDGVSAAADFASDPLGYMEQKLRAGTKGMFSAFGEELTGKKPAAPKNGKSPAPAETGKGN